MKKISSGATYFYKKIFPAIWFGFLTIFLLISVFGFLSNGSVPIAFLVIPAIMAIFGYFLMRALVFDLMDEVYDEGSNLLVKNRNKEERINLKNIKNISYSFMTNPNRVTLSLRVSSQFGNEITFSPPASWVPFKKNNDILELIDRVDKIRSG